MPVSLAFGLTDRYHQLDWPELLALLRRRGSVHADPRGVRWPGCERRDGATAANRDPGPLPTVVSA